MRFEIAAGIAEATIKIAELDAAETAITQNWRFDFDNNKIKAQKVIEAIGIMRDYHFEKVVALVNQSLQDDAAALRIAS